MALLSPRARAADLGALARGVSLLLAFFLATFAFRAGAVAAPPAPEYQLKAVFLYNFAQFVNWPPEAFERTDAPLVIGIVGDDPFGSFLDDLVRGEKIGERPIAIRRFARGEPITACHILFISPSEAGNFEKIIAQLKGRSILSVSDIPSFSRRGGMIRFVNESGKIRMRVNLKAAKSAGLELSSKLLRPATIVNSDGG